ncbi:MAG: sensor histidine kinase [Armatimonadota bacterium]|nr:sensor histidine kinase [Armatimonadota bacterium]MDW8144181.1 sensor histidine kinase [Armatimonadota bacterium]
MPFPHLFGKVELGLFWLRKKLACSRTQFGTDETEVRQSEFDEQAGFSLLHLHKRSKGSSWRRIFGEVVWLSLPNRRGDLTMTERQQRQLVIVACWWAGLVFALLWFQFPYVRGLFQQPPPSLYPLYALAVVYVALRTALVLWMPRWLERDHWLLVPDMLLLAVGVYFAGGIQSDLYLAFFVPIVACGLAYRVRFTLLVAFAAATLHLLATWHDRFEPHFWEYVATRTFFFAIVGWLVSFIARSEEGRRQREAVLQQELAIAQERTRIARELHDSAGNALVAAIQHAQLRQHLLANAPGQAKQQLSEHIATLRQALDEMRELVFHLRPASFSPTEFAFALRQYIARFSQRTGLQINLHMDDLPDLPPAMPIALFRLIQEALTNAVKHGKATAVEVVLKRQGQKLVGEIRDNGTGFDTTQTQFGTGLQTMRERVFAFGGDLTIQSEPKKGTIVKFVLPL